VVRGVHDRVESVLRAESARTTLDEVLSDVLAVQV
jgi:hypothetical protein